MYGLLGIDVRDKLLIHSDGLNVDKTLRLKAHSGALGFKSSVLQLSPLRHLIFSQRALALALTSPTTFDQPATSRVKLSTW